MRTIKQKGYLDIVKIVRRLEKGTTKRLMWAHALGDVFEKNNPRFQKKAFINACGADDEPSNVVDFADRLLER